MSANLRKQVGTSGANFDPDCVVSGLPLSVREPVALVGALRDQLETAGDESLIERLRAQRAEPRFDAYLWSPMELAYTFFEVPGGDVRSSGTRQRRDDLETWIAVPSDLRDEANKESGARLGQLGYLVVYRRRANAFSTALLMTTKAGLSVRERSATVSTHWSTPFVIGGELSRVPGAGVSYRAGRGPSRPFRRLPLRAIWLEAGGKRMTNAELSLVLGHYLFQDGVLVEKETAALRRARDVWIGGYVSLLEEKTGRPPLPDRRLQRMQRDFEVYLKQWKNPRPGSLRRSVEQAWNRAVLAAEGPRAPRVKPAGEDDDAAD